MRWVGLGAFERPTSAEGEKREGLFFYGLPRCEAEGTEGEVTPESLSANIKDSVTLYYNQPSV